MARRRGGYQRPSNPAGASGPGSMSQRTDGRVPKMPVTGLSYGENQEVNDQQSAAPMGAPQGNRGAAPRPGGMQAPGPEGVFGPSGRPGEPMTTGLGSAAQGPRLEENPDLHLQALAQKYQHPDLIALANRRRG